MRLEQIPESESTIKVRRRLQFLINLLYYGVLLAIGILVLRYLFMWMLPFVLAFVVAAGLQRPLGWLVKKTNISRKVFSVILVVFVILLIASIVAVIGWQLIQGIISFVSDNKNIVTIEKTVMGLTDTINEFIYSFSHILSEQAMISLQRAITEFSSNIISSVTGLFTNVAASVASATARLPILLVSFIIWVVASIFLSIDYHNVLSFILRQVPDRHSETISFVRSICTNTLFKLLRAYGLLMFITFVELSIGFTLLRIPYALLLAALIALVDILPVLGTGTVLVPWAFIALIMGEVKMFIGLGIIYIIVTIVRNVLEPRLVSMQIGLNPLVTLFFMFLGLRAIGLLGMLLFPLIVMVLVQLHESGKIRIWK
ncbi:MAG: sporulation integral membrane protein YtvI [Oscillospiraceae bacterium]|nr:sporulation integral membrane protein YtvI [Oscillospiraceae bacterium]